MSEAAIFRLSEALQGSVLKTNDAEPRVLLKFVKRAAGRKVMTLTVELLSRLLETKADQRNVIRIPGELCITPVPPKGKKTFSMNWTRIDVVGGCTAHDVFPLTRMEFAQLQHHLEAMRFTVAKYEAGLKRSREQSETAADPPSVLREADTETAALLRRENKRANVAHDETGPPCELIFMEPAPTVPELTSPSATSSPLETPPPSPESHDDWPSSPESESEAESESLLSQQPASQQPASQDVPQTLELLD